MDKKKIVDFHPKFFSAMKSYSRDKFSADVMAGIIVGIVAIPLAIAFGIASGVGPAEGLVTAILAGPPFCASLCPTTMPLYRWSQLLIPRVIVALSCEASEVVRNTCRAQG